MVKTKTSLNPTQLNVANQTPYLDIDSEHDKTTDADTLKGKAVVIVDPQGGGVYGSTFPQRVHIMGQTGGSMEGSDLYFQGGAGNLALNTNANIRVINIATASDETVRTPTIWKSALVVNAGATIIWAAVANKKHRIMGLRITLVSGTTAAAASLLTLLDAAAATGIGLQVCGAALGAVVANVLLVNESYINGILSAAVNTDWNINLSTALAVAGVFVQVWGTEE